MTFAQLRARHPELTDDQILAMYGAPSEDMGADPDLYSNPFVVTPDGRTVRVDGKRDMAVTQEPEPAIDYADGAEELGFVRRNDRNGGMMRDKETGDLVPDFAMSIGAPDPRLMSNDPAKWAEDVLSGRADPNIRPRPDLEAAGYRPRMVEGADGAQQYIYSPTMDGSTPTPARAEAMQTRELSGGMSGGVDYQRQKRLERMGAKLGLGPEDVAAAMGRAGEAKRGALLEDGQAGFNSMDAFAPIRNAIAKQRGLDEAERRAAVSRRAMLRQNPYEYMGRDDISDEQRRTVAFNLSGMKGATANDIEAINRKALLEGIQQGMRQNLNIGDLDMKMKLLAMQQQQAMRDKDPSLAGRQDIAGGSRSSPQALAEIDRLAEEYDTSPEGFSYQNEMDLVSALEKLGMSRPEAEEAAWRAANKRRWAWNQTGTPAGRRGSSGAQQQSESRGPGNLPMPPGATPYRYGA